MNKFFKTLLCATLAFASVFAFSACDTSDKNEECVNLVSVTATEVGVREGIDYFVMSEPVASAKVSAIPALNFAGDLQELYGGTEGYPQAVVVVKNSLLDSAVVANFVNALEKADEWLLDESTSADTVVNAVQSHLGEGITPMFNAKNLTKGVISNCGIRFTYSVDDRQEIIGFMQTLNSVSETPFGTPSDSFFKTDKVFGNSSVDGDITVYAPDGAPALGLSNIMAGEEKIEGLNVRIVNADTIPTYVAGANPKADICVLPVNAAVKLLGTGEKYTLIGTLTHGNLYMLSSNGGKITQANLSSLAGKTVGIVNIANVPGLTFKSVLKKNNIKYSEVK